MNTVCPACRLRRRDGFMYAINGLCHSLGEEMGVAPSLNPYPYLYRWDRQGRKGQRCKVTARGKFNSIRVEFPDGYVMITSGNAIRKDRANG